MGGWITRRELTFSYSLVNQRSRALTRQKENARSQLQPVCYQSSPGEGPAVVALRLPFWKKYWCGGRTKSVYIFQQTQHRPLLGTYPALSRTLARQTAVGLGADLASCTSETLLWTVHIPFLLGLNKWTLYLLPTLTVTQLQVFISLSYLALIPNGGRGHHYTHISERFSEPQPSKSKPLAWLNRHS